jgi:hypothetical protein
MCAANFQIKNMGEKLGNIWGFGQSVLQAQKAAMELEKDSGNTVLQAQVASMGMRTI